MIITLKPAAKKKEINKLTRKLKNLGLELNISTGKNRTIIGLIGDVSAVRGIPLDAYPCVEAVTSIMKPYKQVSRDFQPENTVVRVGRTNIGGKKIKVIAGPCSVESREMILDIAASSKKAGATFLRGGAFKPRTSPYSFQGLGEEGLKYLAEASKNTGLPVVTELMDPRDLDLICKYADVIQIGARNMQNFRLLKEVGMVDKAVLLKRGLSATVVDLLLSAEYIMSEGNRNVILCERGIRTFEDSTRNTLDLSAVPMIKRLSHLPVVVDPSHAVGKWGLVESMSKAAVASGADGLMIEVHPVPEEALSDGSQSLKPKRFAGLMKDLKRVAKAVGREI